MRILLRPFRFVPSLLFGASLIGLLGFAALWVRSYWVSEFAEYMVVRSDYPIVKSCEVRIGSQNGGFEIAWGGTTTRYEGPGGATEYFSLLSALSPRYTHYDYQRAPAYSPGPGDPRPYPPFSGRAAPARYWAGFAIRSESEVHGDLSSPWQKYRFVVTSVSVTPRRIGRLMFEESRRRSPDFARSTPRRSTPRPWAEKRAKRGLAGLAASLCRSAGAGSGSG